MLTWGIRRYYFAKGKWTTMICFCIDELTSCLKRVETGDIVETEVVTLTRKNFLEKFNKSFVYGEAMDADIEQHYITQYGAQHFPYGEPPHEYRIIIPEDSMARIMEEYTYDETGEQI
ncbi:MAG: hypothetical protein K6G60_03820 [Lachnospiraceae bacterium]|nr:hypothetical protein [Lachnospiraceae bacterium]